MKDNMSEDQDSQGQAVSKNQELVDNWRYILGIASEHKREIMYANIIAIFAP